MTKKITTVNAERFKNTVFFSLTLRKKFGNRARVKDGAKLQAYIEAKRGEPTNGLSNTTVEMNGACKATKKLIISEPYETLREFMDQVKDKLVGRFGKANPSRIKEGLFTVGETLVQEFEDDLTAANAKLQNDLVPAFIADLPDAIERARTLPVKDGGLGPLFDESDYPNADELTDAFGFDWQWLALAVPDGLPEGLRQAAQEKLEKQLSDAADEITQALRTGFQELIQHATEKLSVEPGEKPKVFRDTMVSNIESFIATFSARNVMNDARLAELVEQAKQIIANNNATPERLRKFPSTREAVRQQFAEINAKLGAMIEETSQRKFDLSDD